MQTRYRIIMGAWIIATGLVTVLFYEAASTKALHVSFFDIGQGDAIFIETEGGRQILIDTGRDGKRLLNKLASALPFYDNSIDLLVLTHPDMDHIGGVIEVLGAYQVGGVLLPFVAKDMPLFITTLQILREQDTPVLFAHSGQRIRIDGETTLDILWPPEDAEHVFSSPNDLSIVARLVYKDDSFLFTGDLEERGERILTNLGVLFDSDVLKVGHHGSNTSTSTGFLQRVNPNLAIISVGENSYGHPHKDVLERLSGIRILRTDENGDITLISRGDSF